MFLCVAVVIGMMYTQHWHCTIISHTTHTVTCKWPVYTRVGNKQTAVCSQSSQSHFLNCIIMYAIMHSFVAAQSLTYYLLNTYRTLKLLQSFSWREFSYTVIFPTKQHGRFRSLECKQRSVRRKRVTIVEMHIVCIHSREY